MTLTLDPPPTTAGDDGSIFSDIVQRFDGPLNALYSERDALRVKGQNIVDLVSGNVHQAGFHFPARILTAALAAGQRRAKTYAPNPLGQLAAREAISAYYRTHQEVFPAGSIVITPGTSVSYWYLFKLLANPGDEVLCPRPSYPLLDSIAELCGVRLTHYRLLEKSRWEIDLSHLEAQITPRTRAIVLISPHNPTGAVATEQEIAELTSIAARHRLPVISDEVFSAFLFNTQKLPRPSAGKLPLLFTLNGVSKMYALPGLKIGWIGIAGEAGAVKKAIRALDIISDTFLPVNEAAQFALPLVFSKGKAFLAGYQRAVRQRALALTSALAKIKSLTFIPPEGGFYIAVRLPDGIHEEDLALKLLRKDKLLVHPGYFYDLEGSHVVLSFINPLNRLNRALRKLDTFFDK
jgi:alanine-synthesizing transaminase